MKHKLLIIFPVVFLLLAALMLLWQRNALMGYMLKYAVETKSDGKILFESGKINWNLKSWEITVQNPRLKFHGFFISENDSLEITHISFEKFVIKGLSFKRLFVDKDFVSEKILMEKPYLKLSGSGNRLPEGQKKAPFDPFVLIKILKSRSLGKTAIFLDIDTAVINFGKVNILESKAENSKGSATYGVDITGLKTVERGGENELIYNELKASVGNLNYFFPEKRYSLSLDTLVYSSKNKKLDMAGLRLHNEKAGISAGLSDFFAANINLQGVVLDNTDSLMLKRLFLKKFEIENSRIEYVAANRNSTRLKNRDNIFKLLFRYFPEVYFDTLSLNNVGFLLLNRKSDTVALAENVISEAVKVAFDSSVLKKGVEKLKIGGMSFFSKFFLYQDKGFTFKTDSLTYAGKLKNVTLGKTEFYTAQKEALYAKLKNAEISGFSFFDLLKKKRQTVNVKLNTPYLILNKTGDTVSTGIENGSAFKRLNALFKIEKLNVGKGYFNYKQGQNVDVTATDINFSLGGFSVDSILKKNPVIFYKSMSLNAGNLKVIENNNKISVGPLRVDTAGFFAGKTLFESSQKFMNGKFSASGLRCGVPDLNLLILDNGLKLKKIDIIEPLINVTLFSGANYLFDNKDVDGGIKYFIDRLVAHKGKISFTRFYKSDTLHFSSDFNLDISDFTNMVNEKDVNLLTFGLKNPEFAGKGVLFSSSFATVSQKDSSALFNDVFISLKNKKFELVTKIDATNFTGVDFGLLKKDTLSFANARLIGDTLDFTRYETLKNGNAHDANIQLPLFFDTLFMSYRNVRYVESDSVKNKKLLMIRGLNSEFFSKERFDGFVGDTVGNVFEKCDFDIKRLSLETYSDKSNITAEKVWFENGDVKIKSISASKNILAGKNLYENVLKGLDFTLKQPFYNYYMSELHIKDVSAGKIDLDIETKPAMTAGVVASARNKRKKGKIDYFIIDSAYCNNFNFNYKSIVGKYTNASGLGISIGKINITPESSFVSEPYVFDRLMLDLRNKTIFSDDSLYKIEIKNFGFILPENRLRLDTLTIMPPVDDTLFFVKSKYQTDRIKLFADKTVINRIDIDTLVKSGFLNIQSVVVQGIDVDVLRDKRYPLQPGIKKKMPLQLIKSVPIKFNIDTISTSAANISYSEIVDKSNVPGKVYFSEIKSSFLNVTNSENLYSDFSTLHMAVSGKISGDAPFDININIPYKNNIYNNFWMSANSGIIHFENLNSMTENLLGIYFKSGKGTIDIPFASGNDTVIKGKMIFKYKRLKFGLYNREKAEEYKGIASPFINFVLNNVMIRSNNPRFFGKTKTGIIYYQRDPSKSFVNFVWKGILSGSLSTMGFNTKQQRHEKKEYKKIEKTKVSNDK